MLLQCLFVRNKHLGCGEFKGTFTPRNILYYCPNCGDVWARRQYHDTENPEKTFKFTTEDSSCGCDGKIGSLIFPNLWTEVLNEANPRTLAFIKHELDSYHSRGEEHYSNYNT